MTDEDALTAAVLAEPGDNTARLVYADWLDEHDRPVDAAVQRCCAARDDERPDFRRRYARQCEIAARTEPPKPAGQRTYRLTAELVRCQLALERLTEPPSDPMDVLRVGASVRETQMVRCLECLKCRSLPGRGVVAHFTPCPYHRLAFRVEDLIDAGQCSWLPDLNPGMVRTCERYRDDPGRASRTLLYLIGDAPPHDTVQCELRGGMVERLGCSWAVWRKHHTRLRLYSPVRRVRLTTFPHYEWDRRGGLSVGFVGTGEGGKHVPIPLGEPHDHSAAGIARTLLRIEYPGVDFDLPAVNEYPVVRSDERT